MKYTLPEFETGYPVVHKMQFVELCLLEVQHNQSLLLY